MRRLCAGVIFVGWAAACAFPSVADLGGGDAAVASDATATDAKADAAVDADAAVEAAVVSPCLAPHTFCDDFDHGALGATWDSVTVQAGPLDFSADAITPPNSLHTVLTTANDGQGSYLSKYFSNSSQVHVELDLTVKAPSVTSGTTVLVLGVELPQGPGVSFAATDIQRKDDGGILEEGVDLSDGGSSWQELPFTEPFDTWKRAALDIDWNKRLVVLTIDGAVVQTADIQDVTPQGGVTLDVAVPYSESEQGTWEVTEDNVVVDVQ